MVRLQVLVSREEIVRWREAAGGGPRALGPWVRRVLNRAAESRDLAGMTAADYEREVRRIRQGGGLLEGEDAPIHGALVVESGGQERERGSGRRGVQVYTEPVTVQGAGLDLAEMARLAATLKQQLAGCAKCGPGACGPRCGCACHRRAA